MAEESLKRENNDCIFVKEKLASMIKVVERLLSLRSAGL
jgi:hypothetical protein